MTESFRIPPPAAAVMAVASMAALAGCVAHLDDEHFGVDGLDEPKGSVLEDCTYSPASGHQGDIVDAVSLQFTEGTYWLFAHAPPEGLTSSAVSNSAAITPRASTWSCSALEPVLDASGGLQPVIPLNSEEAAFNLSDPSGREVVLYPSAAVSVDGRGYVFYRKVLLDPAEPPAGLGVGLAEIAFGGVATRLEPQRYPGEPTLFWIYPQDFFGTAALLGDNGWLYVYGCHDFSCFLGRVSPGYIGDVDRYEYRTSPNEYSDRLEQAAVIVSASQLAPMRVTGLDNYYVSLERPTPAVLGWKAMQPTGTFKRLDAPLFEAPSAGHGAIRMHPHSGDEWSMIVTYTDQRMHFVTVKVP